MPAGKFLKQDKPIRFEGGMRGRCLSRRRRLAKKRRFRFAEENPNGISVATSLELEDDQTERSDDLVARVILNRDFKRFNVTLNLFPELELHGHEGHAFGYSIGLRYG
jgi:ABC-type phosphonate transport system ATPase subunit